MGVNTFLFQTVADGFHGRCGRPCIDFKNLDGILGNRMIYWYFYFTIYYLVAERKVPNIMIIGGLHVFLQTKILGSGFKGSGFRVVYSCFIVF